MLARASSSLPAVRKNLLSRRLPLLYDYLSPTPSHLLKLSLAGFIPSIPPRRATRDVDSRLPFPNLTAGRLPAGHHLVYFPYPVTSAQLLPDGLDILHYPGEPFRRRMWAGGSVQFYGHGGPMLNGQRAVCIEGIRDVTRKGKEEDEKLFVRVERRVAVVEEDEPDEQVRERVWKDDKADRGDAVVIEHRDLVFMKNKGDPSRERHSQLSERPQRPPVNFRHTLVPTHSLLFRFSALTFSSHFIHLDRGFARDVDGYRDLLVHGHLTLVLMLSVFQFYYLGHDSGESPPTVIDRISYRNLAPLFVDQPMTVFGEEKNGRAGAFNMWIENEYGLAVKASIQTGTPGRLGGYVAETSE